MLELLLTLAAFGLIVAGVAILSTSGAFIVAGILLLVATVWFDVDVERTGE